jgi:hypothetical protein
MLARPQRLSGTSEDHRPRREPRLESVLLVFHRIVRGVSVNCSQRAPIRPKHRDVETADFVGMNWGELVALPGGVAFQTGGC